ncbi:hypothetical protein [Spiroplasma floricola]|uniref:Uncharacterized protein n=1 Tax=Spiroplasma floricola 23-6 TaxID=1336749 RepID=A0A2K8SFB9_9MOLU|nr:hypothetical protein [Spiroplasma floricola]AUB32045.1 hypothetical protein SFLOR_v1c09970 [Spiroplasma floricola 23-6]
MINILNISLKDEIKFTQENQNKEFIKVSPVEMNSFNIDTIFINEKFTYNKKEYYRLFIRPSLSNAEGYDYFDNFFKKTYQNEAQIYFKMGMIQFYIRTKNGIQPIKNGKEDLFKIPSYIITAKRNGKYILNDFDFIKLDIPASLIEDQQQIFISYSASYDVQGFELKPHTNYGSIEIDRRNLTQHKYEENQCTITIANLAYSYINYDFNFKYKRNYFELLRNDIKIKTYSRYSNTIDPIMTLENKYSLWDYLDLSILGNKMTSFLKLYLKGLNRTEFLTSTPKLKSDSNFGSYYNVKKVIDEVKQKEDNYEIVSLNRTKYLFTKNIVEDSEVGTKGILWNPLYNNSIIYSRFINLNSRYFLVDYTYDNFENDIYKINYSYDKVNKKYTYLINYKIEELNNIGWKNKERIINYINEKEKKL